MRKIAYMLLTVATLLSCDKKEEKNKCLNGGVEQVDHCVCPYGYEGSLCEIAISDYVTGVYKGEYIYNNAAFSRDAQMVIERHPISAKAPYGILTFLRDDTEDFYFNEATVTSKTEFSFEHNTDTLVLTVHGEIIDKDSLHMVVTQTTPTGNDHTVTFNGRK